MGSQVTTQSNALIVVFTGIDLSGILIVEEVSAVEQARKISMLRNGAVGNV